MRPRTLAQPTNGVTRLNVADNDALRRVVISRSHDSKKAGHPGITKTTWLTSQDFWWPNMKNEITNYVQGCATCQSNKNFPGNPKPPSFPIKTREDALPFETIALDFIVKLPNSKGYDTILTITCHDCHVRPCDHCHQRTSAFTSPATTRKTTV